MHIVTFLLFNNLELCVTSSGVKEGLPWRGRPHGNPDGWLRLHHSVRAERAISRMLAEHVQAAQLLLPHLRSHWHPGEKLPRELPFRWRSVPSSQAVLYFCLFFTPLCLLSLLIFTFHTFFSHIICTQSCLFFFSSCQFQSFLSSSQFLFMCLYHFFIPAFKYVF